MRCHLDVLFKGDVSATARFITLNEELVEVIESHWAYVMHHGGAIEVFFNAHATTKFRFTSCVVRIISQERSPTRLSSMRLVEE